MFLFYPKMVLKRVPCDSPKSTCLKKNLVLKCSIFWSSISLERIKWYLSYFSWSWSSSKGSIWKSSSLIGCCQVCLSCNQVVWLFDYLRESSYILFFYACSESSREGSIWDYHFWLCVSSVKLLVKLDCRILWSTISLKRIIWFLSFFMELVIKVRSHRRLSLLVVSGHLCVPGQIGGFFGHQYLWKESIYTFV